MKKLTSILLIVLFLFNIIGYQYVLNYRESQTSATLNKSIEKKLYSTDDLVEIKIPLNNPYISDHNYEDAFGETNINGKYYQYVKKKINGNTLHLLCLPNDEKQTINNTKNKLADTNNTSTNNKNNSKNETPNVVKNIQVEFLKVNQIAFEKMYAIQQDSKSFSLFKNKLSPQQFFSKDLQPPENNI